MRVKLCTPEKLRQLKDVASVPEEEELLSTQRVQVLEEGRTQENQAGPGCVRGWEKIPGRTTANAKGPGAGGGRRESV